MAKPALGRGLGALLSGATATETMAPAAAASAESGQLRHAPLANIRPCPLQPRKDFAQESLQELADSIRAQGILQPLVVRQQGDRFELIAGERRWRAAQLAGLREAPVIVLEADDRAALQIALVENLQRENLNPMEEAIGYQQLLESFQLTQEEAAARVGKSRAVVANALRLLKLPEPVQQRLRAGTLSVGHAKVILGLDTPEAQLRAAEKALREELSVRQTEDLVAAWNANSRAAAAAPAQSRAAPARDAHVADLEDKLKGRLGAKTRLKYRQGKGSIQIDFFSDGDLERLLQLLGISPD